MFAVDDGIWAGNLDAADVLFLIAAIVFAIAAILPHVRRSTVDGTRTVIDFGVSLVPAGLCLLAIAWLIL
jgi:hypothetical protein